MTAISYYEFFDYINEGNKDIVEVVGPRVKLISKLLKPFGRYNHYSGITWQQIYDLALNNGKVKITLSNGFNSYCEAFISKPNRDNGIHVNFHTYLVPPNDGPIVLTKHTVRILERNI